MKRNPRYEKELADFLKCKPWQVISYTPTPDILEHTCGECKYYASGWCNLDPADPLNTVFSDMHSCRHFKPKQDHP